MTFWDDLANVANQHVEKGQQIYVSGRLISDTVEGDDGKEQLTRDAQQDVSLINEFSRLAASRGDTAFAKKMNDKTDMLIQKMSKELNMESMMGPRP